MTREDRRAVALWLLICAAVVFAIVVVGGITRLTRSGLSIVGLGMRSHAGIAAQMFRTLAEEGINIQMISTSEIKITVVIDEKYAEAAVRVLHRVFELDQEKV